MSMFANLADQQKDAEKEKDILGGRRPMLPTDAYDAKIETVYATKSAGGANALNFVFKVGDQTFRSTQYITSKKGESFYMTKDNKKSPLPGYALVNALTKLTAGKEIPALVFEDKIVKIYNFDTKKEEPKTMPVAVELSGLDINIGIELVLENKRAKDQAGQYVDTPETKEVNEWTRVFHPTTGQTVSEYDAQKPSEFKAAWLAKFKGVVRDETNKALKSTAPAAGTSSGSVAGASAAKTSLFGG